MSPGHTVVPAIHVFGLIPKKTWMPGTRPGMTSEAKPRITANMLRYSVLPLWFLAYNHVMSWGVPVRKKPYLNNDKRLAAQTAVVYFYLVKV
jgi:hypothetical protein